MKKTFSLRNLYLYLSSFAALLFFLFGTVSSVGNLVQIFSNANNYRTYSTYKAGKEDTPELRAQYEEDKALDAVENKQRKIETFSYSFTSLALGLFFWLFFWKQTKKDN